MLQIKKEGCVERKKKRYKDTERKRDEIKNRIYVIYIFESNEDSFSDKFLKCHKLNKLT